MRRRLALLVFAESGIAAVLVCLALSGMRTMQSGTRFMHRYVLVPVREIASALDSAAALEARGADPEVAAVRMRELSELIERYRAQSQVFGNEGEDAKRQLMEVRTAGRMELIEEERRNVDDVVHEIDHLRPSAGTPRFVSEDVRPLRASLRRLMDINFDFMQLAEADVESTARRMMLLLTSIGVIGVFTAMVLGRRVQQAIAPRIEDLVLKIKRFQELGVHERMFEEGEDEIALLANAIDAGFAAIAARAREREQFLAIVAHELKTPVTSIQGFAEAALVSPNQSSRALEVIKRQSNRLGRLIDDLLWAARARYGDLPFCPVPVDLAFLVHKITREIDSPIHPFRLEGLTELRVLADEGLMTHALVSLFTYAIALSAPHTGIVTRLGRVGVRARTDVYVQGPPVPSEDIVRIFDPFSVLQYESDARPRTAVGLFLCREILRLHGGSVHVADEPGVGLVLTLEMPA